MNDTDTTRTSGFVLKGWDVELKVRELIQAGFALASSKYPDVHKAWVSTSYAIGGWLPSSTLSFSVQRGGELDVLLRCMEDEFSPNAEMKEPDYAFGYQASLSELWVGHFYEIFRLLKDRKCVPENKDFDALAQDLRLLRIPLEKHEIAGDRKLKEPLMMKRHPAKNDMSDIYEYSKDDPTRSHIMPMGVSTRGSVVWQALDISSNQSYWLERRGLSERIIAMFEDAGEKA